MSMLPLAALKKRAKEKAFQHLIGVMRGMESEEHDPLEAHQNQEDKVLDQMDQMIEPEYDDAGHPSMEEPSSAQPDEEDEFAKERAGFMKRSGKNPPVKGKSRMVMVAAESKPRMAMGSKKRGY